MPSILESLGTLPNGMVRALTPDQLSRHLRERYAPTLRTEQDRRDEMRTRLDLYKDRGRQHFEKILDKLFKNLKVRALRKELLELAEFQNLTARIVREISTVYAEPAKRKIDKGQKKYKEFQEKVRLDRVMRKLNRLGNLCNDVLAWPDVGPAGPVLRLVTPDKFVPVPHPNDPCLPVAYIIDQYPSTFNVQPAYPHYLGMSDTEFFWLDKNWFLVKMEPHSLGRMPALLWSREEPDEGILDSTSGRDVVSAHLAIALLNVMMLKHQKSGARVPYATGDTSDVGRDQPMEEENIIELGEGVTLNTLDLGADPESYIKAGRSVIKQVAANRGIPESVFDLSYQATSGFEIELKRTGLREVRREQILTFRPFEKDLAELWSVVLREAGSEWAFDAAGFSVNFGEIDTPQDPQAKLAYWEKLEALGLTSALEMYMEMNPEASEEQAAAEILENHRMRLAKVRMFQEQEASSDLPKKEGGQVNSDRGAAEAVEETDGA